MWLFWCWCGRGFTTAVYLWMCLVFLCTADLMLPGRLVKRLPRPQSTSPRVQHLERLAEQAVFSPAVSAPYLHLPVSLDSLKPLLDPGHLLPSAGSGLEPLPPRLQELLRGAAPDPQVPPELQPHPGASVRVDCKHERMYVEVERAVLGRPEQDRALRLGICGFTKATEEYVYFEYELDQCGTQHQMERDQVVFFNTLHYEPETSVSTIRRSAPFSLHLSCRFNRYQYSFKIGYRPNQSVRSLFKRMKNREKFTLSATDSLSPMSSAAVSNSVCTAFDNCSSSDLQPTALWQPLSPSSAFSWGRPMLFQARAEQLSPGHRLYLHSCFATAEPWPSSRPQLSIIHNHGCMVESQHGRSSFINRTNDAVRFSVDTFIFPGSEGNPLYMHCYMSLGPDSPTVTDKSCNYNLTSNRWEELSGRDSVCSCCASVCGPSVSTETVISSKAWNIHVKPRAKKKKKKNKSPKKSLKLKSRPETTEALGIQQTKTPETMKTPATVKTPETMKTPAIVKTPETMKTPVTTKTPETVKTPETPDSPRILSPRGGWGESGQGQPFHPDIRWAVTEQEGPRELEGSAEVEEVEEVKVEKVEKGEYSIFEEIFDLYEPQSTEIKS